jgi:hypothetical protein
MDLASFFDLAVDIHHIFPKVWCAKNGIDQPRRESIVNKTALSARTNRKIGGRSPRDYLKVVEAESGIAGQELDVVLSTHLLDPAALRTANFEAFFADRRSRILQLIRQAMGKPVVDADPESPTALVEEDEELADTVTEVDLGGAPEDVEATSRAMRLPSPHGGREAISPTLATVPGFVSPSRHSFSDVSGPPQDAKLQRDFHAAMVNVYRRAKEEAGYHATLFLRMVSEHGGLVAAQRLLHSPTVSDGFRALWERGRLDLTMEALVQQAQFASLFTEEELEIARDRLEQYGYSPS